VKGNNESVIEWVSKASTYREVHTGWPSICWVGGWVSEWVGGQCYTSLVQGQLLMGPESNFCCTLYFHKVFVQFQSVIRLSVQSSKAKIRTWISSVGLIFDQTKCLISYMIHHLRHNNRVCCNGKIDFSSCNEYDSNCGPSRFIKVNTVMPPSSLISSKH
jgi:hypothetical protein